MHGPDASTQSKCPAQLEQHTLLGALSLINIGSESEARKRAERRHYIRDKNQPEVICPLFNTGWNFSKNKKMIKNGKHWLLVNNGRYKSNRFQKPRKAPYLGKNYWQLSVNIIKLRA